MVTSKEDRGIGTAVMGEEESIKIKDFDDLFPYIGGWGRFQIQLGCVSLPFFIFMGYLLYSPILTLYTPPHWCYVPSLAHLSKEERRNLAIPNITRDGVTSHSQCTYYKVDWTEVKSLQSS